MHYSIKIGKQTFSVDIEDLNACPIMVMVDGEEVEVWPEEKGLSIKQPRLEKQSSPDSDEASHLPTEASQPAASSRAVKAPIPGVIIEINVTTGQSVNRGDLLCILEAMKMKNSIRAGRSGVIGSIPINVGDQVRHGQSLIEFTE
jgi:glutaconyl-CoA/methylmalonyl-CoA decarboxylase subunit gamma